MEEYKYNLVEMAIDEYGRTTQSRVITVEEALRREIAGLQIEYELLSKRYRRTCYFLGITILIMAILLIY
jgi:hypothetical protein